MFDTDRFGNTFVRSVIITFVSATAHHICTNIYHIYNAKTKQ